MGILSQILGVFSQSSRHDNQLQRAFDLAKNNQPTEAVAILNALLKSSAASETVKSRALFNRALAYSSLNDDAKATADLQQLITSNSTPENVRTAARNQLVRIRNRA